MGQAQGRRGKRQEVRHLISVWHATPSTRRRKHLVFGDLLAPFAFSEFSLQSYEKHNMFIVFFKNNRLNGLSEGNRTKNKAGDWREMKRVKKKEKNNK